MALLGLFLAMIGSADLLRNGQADPGPFRRLGAVAVAAVIGMLGFWGLGRGTHDLWLLLIGIALVAAWLFADMARDFQNLALGALTVAVVILLGFGQHLADPRGWLHTWYSSLEIAALAPVPFESFLLGAGCLLFLLSTANQVVRLVLRGAGPQVAASSQTLKGGRIIGPLERLLIFAMCLGGHFAAVGAVIAAKGILRFPEISRADDDGDIAEYVLVGSFVSWVLALVFIPLF